MDTFKAYFKKEVLEASRHYRYLVLGIGFVLFAILDPVMLKLMPKMLEGQIPGDLSTLFAVTVKGSLKNYIDDVYQIGNLFVTLSIMGMISDEVREKKLVFPYSKGCSPSGIVVSKTLNYSLCVGIFLIFGLLLNYYYSLLLFNGETVAVADVIRAALYLWLYYAFNISMIAFFSSLFRKGIAAGIVSLVVSYFMPLFIRIDVLSRYLPYALVNDAGGFETVGRDVGITICVTSLYIIILNAGAIHKLGRTEIQG